MSLRPENMIDFYKSGHIYQYPKNTTCIYSNFTPRSGYHFPVEIQEVVFFGLQGVIKKTLIDLWDKEFFQQPLDKILARYKRRMDTSLGEGSVGTDHIEALHKLRFLPITIKALPEGSKVPFKVPVFTIYNSPGYPEFFWLVNYLETLLSTECWKATTSATIAHEYRKVLEQYANETGADPSFCDWQAHDFSMRGLSNIHDAGQSGSGHLLSFLGTDTVPALDYLEDYYGGASTFLGGSVPATEHSVMSMGSKESEIETFRRLVTEVYPSGIVSIVSDTWDFWKVISEYALELKPEIIARTPNALGLNKVVFRPDSGDPADILCGEEITEISLETAETFEIARMVSMDRAVNKVGIETAHGERGPDTITSKFFYNGECFEQRIEIDWNRYDKQYYYQDGYRDVGCDLVTLTPAQKGAVQCLWDIYGGTVTDKGFKVLDQHVGLIYGDSITLERAKDILTRLKKKGFASSNIVFGIGL